MSISSLILALLQSSKIFWSKFTLFENYHNQINAINCLTSKAILIFRALDLGVATISQKICPSSDFFQNLGKAFEWS